MNQASANSSAMSLSSLRSWQRQEYQSFSLHPCVRVAALPLVSKTVTKDNGTQSQLLQRSRFTPGGRNILLEHSLSTCIMSLLVHICICIISIVYKSVCTYIYIYINKYIHTHAKIESRETVIETQPIPSKSDPLRTRFWGGLSTAIRTSQPSILVGSCLGGLGFKRMKGKRNELHSDCILFNLHTISYLYTTTYINKHRCCTSIKNNVSQTIRGRTDCNKLGLFRRPRLRPKTFRCLWYEPHAKLQAFASAFRVNCRHTRPEGQVASNVGQAHTAVEGDAGDALGFCWNSKY